MRQYFVGDLYGPQLLILAFLMAFCRMFDMDKKAEAKRYRMCRHICVQFAAWQSDSDSDSAFKIISFKKSSIKFTPAPFCFQQSSET